jgi:hypothetical protein
MAQLHDEGLKIIKQKLSQGEKNTNVSAKIRMESYGLKAASLFQRIMNSKNKLLMRLIFPNSLFTRVVAKCIKTSDKIFGGLE